MPDDRLRFATKIALEAGKLAQSMRADPTQLMVQEKGYLDLVTAADHAVENLLREQILAFDPGATILGEEAGLDGDTSAMWILDPIDGTVNFARGMPDWAISIGYFDGIELTHGVIHAPDLQLTAVGAKGMGATLNGAKIELGKPSVLSPIVALGYSPRSSLDDYLARIENLLAEGIEHRRHGAATICFLGVLAGWFDAYFEPKLNVWDAAAGLVLIEAAGGKARHDSLQSFLNNPSDIFAQNNGDFEKFFY